MADTLDTSENIVTSLLVNADLLPRPARATPKLRSLRLLDAGPSLPVSHGEIPKTLDDLGSAVSRGYDLNVKAAAEASIPVVGSGGGSYHRRVVVLERCAYKALSGNDDTEYQYGYAIRLCVTVNRWDASLKLALPFLAASAQLGQIEASWTLQVLGLAGARIDAVSLPPTELNIETFVLAKQSLTALVEAVRDPTTKFEAQCIVKLPSERVREGELRAAVASAYALTRIGQRAPLDDALARLNSADQLSTDNVRAVYEFLAGGSDPTQKPSEAAAQKSRELLGRVRADV